VPDVAGLALVAGGGHDDDDAAARAALDHEPGDGLGAEKGPGEVDRQLTGPPVQRHVENPEPPEDAGVVDEDVGSAPRFAHAPDPRRDGGLVGDVTGDGQCLTAAPADPLGALSGVVGDDVDAGDAGPLSG